MPNERKSWTPFVFPVLAAFVLCLLDPQPLKAIPAFARKYDVKCYTCHIIPPALNKTGYMFRRLGYRMPPDEMDGTKPAPKISELDKDVKWSITNSLALVGQGSFTVEKTRGEDTSSTSSFNFDKALLFAGGAVPETNFSYFVEFAFAEDGEASLHQASFGYTAGRANSSFFGKAGQMLLQEGEGTRAVMMFNLFDEPSSVLLNSSPINFSLDQGPVGVDVGYTYATPFFKQILGLSAKVTNGVDESGEAILFDSKKNSKDFWFDADYWFGPDGGISFVSYYGRKNQIQNAGTPDEFNFYPTIRRNGVFGNYLFFDKLDVQGGYLRSDDDWRASVDQTKGKFKSNAFRAEVDYYLQRGFAVMARYDRINQKIDNGDKTHIEDWGVGIQRALTPLGNVIVRAAYTHESVADPVTNAVQKGKLLKVDLRLMW
ncbi:MAG: hypothetical protein HY236_15660 [Acidobacteria bacterium]|nr:hypothetical protein [Acidobacteriota bacterium]